MKIQSKHSPSLYLFVTASGESATKNLLGNTISWERDILFQQ